MVFQSFLTVLLPYLHRTGKWQHLQEILENIKFPVVMVMAVFIFNRTNCKYFVSDATTYAHHVFKAFDVTSCGSISFKVCNKIFLSPIKLVWNSHYKNFLLLHSFTKLRIIPENSIRLGRQTSDLLIC